MHRRRRWPDAAGTPAWTENGGPKRYPTNAGTAGFIKRFGIVDTVAVTGLLLPMRQPRI